MTNRAFEDALNKIVESAGDSFLERFAKDAINDSVRWAENTSGNPADYLNDVCQILLLERGLGTKLISRAFCELNFLDDAEDIIQDFGLEKTNALLRKENKHPSDEMSAQAKAAIIIEKSLPGSKRVAEYVTSVIQERDDWKSILKSYSEMRDV